MGSLQGQVLGVTGAGGGLGQALTAAAAAAGMQVVRFGRRDADYALDLADPAWGEAEAAALVAAAAARAGPFDAWVNLAGADILSEPWRSRPYADRLEYLWRVDVRGTMLLSRAVLPHLNPRGRPQILNVAWDRACTGMAGPFGELYAAAKAAIIGFSRSLALSVGPRVRVNVLAPGWVRTRWADSLPEARRRALAARMRAGRWQEPADLAAVIVALLAMPPDVFQGQVFYLDGGDVLGGG
ncbi:NAD(P)-dependent oxidoreductase [Candidatus Hydrogenisulfobacillus filiaventi]|uniref:NAD(P)-dependent oxidoreductase n=1 Tax=Candidatus Hydrogenisulfobacillus filiaventi TaxID=2707344 RepID=A0A6F8ZH69_9FIRM|nr:SDR family NAD(P)-dependent oxidoreductase [Bacillota bacterium]CAB1129063.1 NAD(P)-dependent oxidoreductase [Candidatus Hydrogenisulfobacillus filiaventi]